MTFIDKVREGAEQAAARARAEVKDLQAKRELNQAYGELGRQVFDLLERGEISHAQLEGPAGRVRELREQAEGGQRESEAPAESAAGEES